MILNKNLSSKLIIFVKIKPCPLSHSNSTGLFGVKVLFPLTFQTVFTKGKLTFPSPPIDQPDSTKYSFENFLGFKKVTLSSPFKVFL